MKHTATPKTWDVRKQGRGYEQRDKMTEASRASVSKLISEATGFSEAWLMGKPDGLLMGLARKHL